MTLKALTETQIDHLNRACPALQRAQLGSFLGFMGVISQEIAVGGFTDGGGTSGTLALADKLPAGAIPLGWKFVGTGAFDGDTSAVMKVGKSGDDDMFSADTSGSVFAAATIGSLPIAADGLKGVSAEVTVLVTVTTATDFTTCKTSGKGKGTIYLYYLSTE